MRIDKQELEIVINIWTRTYQGITNCYRIIYQIQTRDIPIEANDTTALIAEIKLARAYFYWVLCDIYGNVPIVDKYNIPTGYLPKQNTRQEAYDFVISELKANIPLDSVQNDGTTYREFNKWSGLVLLVKMYLNAEVYTGTAAWEECRTICDTIINIRSVAKIDLESNQKNVFLTENQNSMEIIFALPIDSKYVAEWNSFDVIMQTLQPENQATYNLQFSPGSGVCTIPQFFNTFNIKDTKYIDVLMMRAECLLRTGDEGGAAAIVTEVRQRNFKSYPAKAAITGTDLLNGSSYDYGPRNHLTSTIEVDTDITKLRLLIMLII